MKTAQYCWDLSSVSTPKRSSIPHLKPVGLGTPLVESLTSYLSRLTLILHVSISTLVNKALFSELKIHYRDDVLERNRIGNYSLNKIQNLLNGKSGKAEYICEALELIIGLKNMSSMTLNPCSRVAWGSFATRDNKAWCPICLSEWRKSGQIIYEPLLWFIESVEICAIHKRYLEHVCPTCNRPVEFSTNPTSPGFCSQCKTWLGRARNEKRNEQISEDELSACIWRHENVGRILSLSQSANVGKMLSHSQLDDEIEENPASKAFIDYLRVYCDDDIAAFSHEIGWSRRDALAVCLEYAHLSLEAVISICRNRRLDVVKFLFEGQLVPLRETRYPVSQSPIPPNTTRYTAELNSKKARKLLLSFLNGTNEVVPSMDEVARGLRCSKKTLFLMFPDLCNKIHRRYRRSLQNPRIAKLRHARKLVRDETIRLYSNGSRPREEYVLEHLKRQVVRGIDMSSAEFYKMKKEQEELWSEREVKSAWYETLYELGISNVQYVFTSRWTRSPRLEEIPYPKLDRYAHNGALSIERIRNKVDEIEEDYLISTLQRI